jgi:hypothetical protein
LIGKGRLDFAAFQMTPAVNTLASYDALRSAGHAVLVATLLYAGFLVVVTIHELGHYLAGIAWRYSMAEGIWMGYDVDMAASLLRLG